MACPKLAEHPSRKGLLGSYYYTNNYFEVRETDVFTRKVGPTTTEVVEGGPEKIEWELND